MNFIRITSGLDDVIKFLAVPQEFDFDGINELQQKIIFVMDDMKKVFRTLADLFECCEEEYRKEDDMNSFGGIYVRLDRILDFSTPKNKLNQQDKAKIASEIMRVRAQMDNIIKGMTSYAFANEIQKGSYQIKCFHKSNSNLNIK
jgi:hypothetical protein